MIPYLHWCYLCYCRKLKVIRLTSDFSVWRYSLISLSNILMMTLFMILRVNNLNHKNRLQTQMKLICHKIHQLPRNRSLNYCRINCFPVLFIFCRIMTQCHCLDLNYYRPLWNVILHLCSRWGDMISFSLLLKITK